MIIAQAMSLKIVSVDTSHNIFSINRYIIKLPCIFKLVRAYLREQRQLRLILWCLSLMLPSDPTVYLFYQFDLFNLYEFIMFAQCSQLILALSEDSTPSR